MPPHPRLLLWPLALLAALCASACSREHEAAAPRAENAPVILISIDTLRADHLPVYGYRGVETPAIDALAGDGITYANAWSHCPMTLPSHLSMLTGLLPAEHGVRNNVGYRFAASDHPTVPSLLAARGYATGAAVSSYVLRADTGLAAAFSFYDDGIDPRPGAAFTEYQRPGVRTAAVAERWIEQQGSKPFFLMLHLYEPHVPYDPPEPYRSRYANRYDGEIAAADAVVGAVIARLKQRGLYDRSLIILTSDHGEGLGDHGEQQHSILLYRELLRVPLIVKLPGHFSAKSVVQENVQSIDIAPTILSVVGATVPGAMHGTSLIDSRRDRDREIYAETIYPRLQLGWSDLASLVTGRHHYIDGPRPELYDWSVDSGEHADRLAGDRRLAADLRTRIALYRRPITPPVLDPDASAKLAALGYVGSLRTAGSGALANPVDHIAELEHVREALQLAAAGKTAEAVAAMRRIVAANPHMVDVWLQLAETERNAGDLEAAAASYRAAIAAAPFVSGDALVSYGELSLLLGKAAEARGAATVALPLAPAKSHELLANVALAEGTLDEAQREAEAAVAASNGDPLARLLLGRVALKRGDLAGATAIADEAERVATASEAPALYGLHALRGEVLANTPGREKEARTQFEAEIAAFPSNMPAYVSLAVLQMMDGRRGEAERTLQRLSERNPNGTARALAKRTREAFRAGQ
jgi:choline-sulfatase